MEGFVVRMLFIVTAALETATGVLLLLLPAAVLALLFAWRGIGPETALVARVAGGAVLGLGVASWLAREDGGGPAQRGLLAGLLIYNALVAVFFVFAGVVLRTVGLFLWPAVACHVALLAWSAAGLRRRSAVGHA